MRLFVAIELPRAVIAAATVVSQSLRERVALVAPAARVTWVSPDRLHVTLRFLGQMGDGQAAAIARVMAHPFEVPAFTISFGDVGTFPERGAPRAVWIALTAGLDACRRLEADVSSRLEPLGIPREPRPFSPHLTLARVREGSGLRGTALTGITMPRPASGPIDAITLFESRLSSRGPTYIALQRTSLHVG